MQSKSGNYLSHRNFSFNLNDSLWTSSHSHLTCLFVFENFHFIFWFRNSYMIEEKCGGYNSKLESWKSNCTSHIALFFLSLHKSLLDKYSRKNEKHLEHVGVFVAKRFDYISRDVMLFVKPAPTNPDWGGRAGAHPQHCGVSKSATVSLLTDSPSNGYLTHSNVRNLFFGCIKKWSGTLQKPKQSFTQKPWTYLSYIPYGRCE